MQATNIFFLSNHNFTGTYGDSFNWGEKAKKDQSTKPEIGILFGDDTAFLPAMED